MCSVMIELDHICIESYTSMLNVSTAKYTTKLSEDLGVFGPTPKKVYSKL